MVSDSGERRPAQGWSRRPLTSDRIARLAAVATIAAFLYCSLLPFELEAPDVLHPIAWLEQVQLTSWALTSRTDLAVNVVVGTFLGFFLMGGLRAGRGKHLNPGLAVLVVVFASSMLGIAVELLQVLLPDRIGSWNDPLGQMPGVVAGALGWILIGCALLRWLQALANERESLPFAAGVLQLYLPLYVLIQLTPLERDLAARYSEGRIGLLPVTHYFVLTFPMLRNVVADVLLSAPIGALGVLAWVARGTHRRIGRAVLLGGSIVVGVEIIHSVLWSHYASLIDILSGTAGTAIGAAATVAWSRSRESGGGRPWRLRLLLLFLMAWILLLIGEYWYPFDFLFTRELAMRRLADFPWIPFESYYPSYSAAPLDGIRELLKRFLLTVPLGLLVQSALQRHREAWHPGAPTMGIALVLMAVIAVGELFLPAGYPDTTEMALGAMGAAVGSAIAGALARCRITELSGSGTKGSPSNC
jgi:glycopeptide antibiotics resistance protein